MRCAIYVRLSKEDSEKERGESESIQNQKALLLRYAAEQGWELFQIYCDEDYSGADRQRPAFNRMLQDAREGRFQILLCKTQSRFTRDMELVERYLHGLFPLWGIRFLAVADHVDTALQGNKKARQINGLVNEWYLEDLSQNIRMVFDVKRRQGKYLGSRPLYGYRKDPEDHNHLLIDPEAAGVVRQIFQWFLAGHGSQAIARMLNDRAIPNPTGYRTGRTSSETMWNKTTVWRILHNEMYTGVMLQGRRRKVSYKSDLVVELPRTQWVRVEGTHEAIVSPSLFQAVQQGLHRRARSDGTGTPHLLSGLVRCMDCGSTMSKTANGRQGDARISYLRCQGYVSRGRDGGCTRHSIRLDHLTQLVCGRIRSLVQEHYQLNPHALPVPQQDTCRHLEREARQLLAQLADQKQVLKQLCRDRAAGVLEESVFAAMSKTFSEEQHQLEHRLAQVQAQQQAQSTPPALLLERAQALLRLEEVPRELVVLLIRSIEVGERQPQSGKQEICIHWNF